MRRRSVWLVAVALAVAGCGSKSKNATTHRTVTTSPTRTATTTATTAARGDCNALGINPTGMQEGTCTHAGITYVIVDENHALRLHSLTAMLNGIRTENGLAGTQPAGTAGKFVVISITVTNHLELPQSFDRTGTQQAGLILAGTVYKEASSVEKTSDPNSCLSRTTPIANGKSETCDVIFEVPASSAADLGRHGSGDLYLVDFGSDLAGSIPPQTVGQIRLYR